jgi:signal transduction histidine kinase
MMTHSESDGAETWLVNLPASPRQSRISFLVAIALIAGLGATAPFADLQLPRLDAFIPATEIAVIITDFITAALLFSQARIYHSRAVLAVASGYLFTALIVIPHVLTFPGAFAPTGLLRAGPQTTGWLYTFWHLAFPSSMLVYACLKDEKLTEPVTQTSNPFAVRWSVATVIILVCGLTWLAIAGDPFLPPVFLDATHLSPFARYVLTFEALICVLAFALVLRKRRSVLDQWLMVVALAFFSELVINGLLISGRFTLGWYVSRIFSICTSTIVLVVLLSETTRLYGRLARSNAMLLREKKNRLMNLEALAASIAHEVRQPLTSIVMSGSALQRFLSDTPPKLEKAHITADRIIAAGHRASQILDDIRKLFGTDERTQDPVDVNALTLTALRAFDSDLKKHNIATRVELKAELPQIVGHSGQLQEVLVNLIQNAIDAMDMVDDDRRILRVKTEYYGNNAIRVEIEDTGPGIDPKKSDSIFDAFFTTKPHGMGLGLAICRMIIERHGGQLVVSSADPHGAIFCIILPQMRGVRDRELAA